MIVELHAKSDVGRVRRGNEDNFLVLELSKQQTWTATDGEAEPANMGNFELGERDWCWLFPTEWVAHWQVTLPAAWP